MIDEFLRHEIRARECMGSVELDHDVGDANAIVGGDQGFSFIGTGAFSHTAGELRYEQVNGSTFISGDANGGIADFYDSSLLPAADQQGGR